ncbi:hypothetical protein ASD65_10585 [Microbacterium sp. Root61]|uniref:hypothetical protein n=1 Tax=Microbacterium sp. Root61 TaxID=1736570 RepID=UPI0006F5CEB4|nr:hypothetical protein [Microbacterium sp. Root61]KRA24819.1 hypothetical protein ASD65_10585 [Microbacterium sp. Root61]
MTGFEQAMTRSGESAGHSGVAAHHSIHAELAAILPAPGWAIVFGDNDTGLHDLHFYVWIIRCGSTVGLIDAGLPLDAVEADALGATNQAFGDPVGFRQVRTLPEILADAGVDPAEVAFVAITQTVTYHSGGIDAALLPNATFYLARDGVREFLEDPPGHPAPEFYFSASSWDSLRTLAIEGRLRLVAEREQVRPGVLFEVTGGHHPGSAAVLIDTSEGVVGIIETAFVKRNIESGTPIGIAEDIAAARRATTSLGSRCDRLVAIHDPANGTDFAEVADERR